MNFQVNYNPDILTCLANLSNDEVFTPPHIVNQMLDLLPPQLFNDPRTTFFDPVSKTGVFLREIAKRLMVGLAPIYPDEQERRNHILQHQLFGIAITDLTSLLSRRSVYGSKKANHPKYSFCTNFGDNEQGNILYNRIEHIFKNDKCIFCGANKETYGRDDTRENYAYQFIHTDNPETLFNMKFDVIIGNPPYQLKDGGSGTGNSALPIYHLFVEQAKKLQPRYLCMIIPARWYAGGRGLDEFRELMLKDRNIKTIVDFPSSKDCFPGVNIAGGVCYFLRDKNHVGSCKIININNQNMNEMERPIGEFSIFLRSNLSVSIIKKVMTNNFSNLEKEVFPSNPFGFRSFIRGYDIRKDNSVLLFSSEGLSYIDRNSILKNIEVVDRFKVTIGKIVPNNGEVDTTPEMGYKVITNPKIYYPNEIHTESYLLLSHFETLNEAKNFKNYIQLKFTRFLLKQTLSSMNITKSNFQFVPMQDFTEEWTDEKLYKKYGLTEEEIAYIESIIRPMDATLFDETPQEILPEEEE